MDGAPKKRKKREVLDEYNNPVVRSRTATLVRAVIIVVVAAVNLFWILRVFAACDAPLADTMLYSATLQKNLAAATLRLCAPQDFSAYSVRRAQGKGALFDRFTGNTTMDDEGHLQVKNICYFEGADNLQFTMKQNARYYARYNENGNPLLSYLVRVIDRDGNTSYCDTTLGRTLSEERFGYVYTRVSFDKLPLEIGADYVTLYVFLTDELDQTVLAVTLYSQTTAVSHKQIAGLTFTKV